MAQAMDRYRRWIVAAIFLALLLTGLWMLPSRTQGGDESIENYTLSVNMKEYVGLFMGEDSPLYQSLAQFEPIEEWRDRDYGQARSYWIWPLMQMTDQMQAKHWLYHGHIYVTFLLGLYALYRIVWRLTGSWGWGLAGMGLLALNPRLFAESFYNNKDSMLLSLCLVVLWLGLAFAEKRSWLSCVWFGAAGAFAANARVIGLGAFGLMGLVYLAQLSLHRLWDRRAFLRGALAVAVFLLVFFLITPASWSDFLGFWGYYLGSSSDFSSERWNQWVLYRGAVYNPTENPVPWHYIPWLITITTPILILALALAWPVLWVLRCKKERAAWCSLESLFCGALCLFAGLPLGYAMVVRPNLYNGWRHFYFVYASIAVLAALSGFLLWRSRRRWLRRAVAVVLGAHFLYYAGFIAVSFPHDYAYFNLLAGPHPEQRYDADYWWISLPRVLEDILEMDPDARVCDVGKRPNLRQRWYALKGEQPQLYGPKAEEVTWERRWRARYVLENTSYWAIERLHNDWTPEEIPKMDHWMAALETAPVLREWKCGGTVVWRLYENPEYRE